MPVFTRIICGMFVFNCMANEINFPPSQYIGFYDEYLGFKNGQLPNGDQRFTGYWRVMEGKRILLEGQYSNGIPVGVWKEFSNDGIIRRQCVYGDNTAFTETVYYPDGKPRLKVTGLCLHQLDRVYRRIDSIQRMDTKPQDDLIPYNRMEFSSSLIRSRHDEYSESYLMLSTNDFTFSMFQFDFDLSQWDRNIMIGTLDWQKNELLFQQQPPSFLYSLDIHPFGLDIIRTDKSAVYCVDMPQRNTSSHDFFKVQQETKQSVLYITERHILSEMTFTNYTTGNTEKVPFQVIISGFYLPGKGWSDITVEPVGSLIYPLTHSSLFSNHEKPFPAGTILYLDYWGSGFPDNLDDTFAYNVGIVFNRLVGILVLAFCG